MANFLQFLTPSGENVQFTLTAQADGSAVLHSQDFITASSATEIFLKVFATGQPDTPLQPNQLVEGSMYDIEAFEDAAFTIPADIASWTGSGVEFISFNFTADRRPLYIIGYATTTQSAEQITFGTGNNASKRRTPLTSASDSDFLDPAQNGRIDWIDGDATNAINFGIERINYSNVAGWTSLSSTNTDWPTQQGNNQPHYPSNPYTGMALTEARIMSNYLTTDNSVVWQTPFTVDGYSSSDPGSVGDTTPGDQRKAWKAAVQYTKDLITTAHPGATPEVVAYCGYRPLWTDKTQTAFDKTLLGYSKPSTGNNPTKQWDGLAVNSPGWTPEPGWDGTEAQGGTSATDETFSAWFDEEAAGLYELGFTSIGLDTGARVWNNAAGQTNSAGSSQYTNRYGSGPGNDRLIELFNGYGLKPYFESVALDRWTHMSPPITGPYDASKLVPMQVTPYGDSDYYTKAATWAFFGSWWGYVSDGGYNEYNGSTSSLSASGGSVWNPTNTDGGATVGDPTLTGARVLGNDTEVHAVFRWGGQEIKDILDLSNGWDIMRQIMYDFDQAGLIVSPSAATSGDYAGVSAADFYGYIMDLYNGTATRPVILPESPPQVTIVSTTPPITDAPNEGNQITVTATVTGNPTPDLTYTFTNLFTTAVLQTGTSNVYTPTSSDVGQFIKVDVEGSNTVGTDTKSVAWQQPVTAIPNALQQITWTMTSASNATVTSTGLDIISAAKTNELSIADAPRIWNGTEADNSGATSGTFPSSAANTAWWTGNYWLRVRQDGGDWLYMQNFQDPANVYFGGSSTKYNNIGQAGGVNWITGGNTSGSGVNADWTAMAAGQVIDIEVWPRGTLVDGFGVVDTYTKDFTGSPAEPRAQTSGKWFRFENGTWANGGIAGLNVNTNTDLIPYDSSAAHTGITGLTQPVIRMGRATDLDPTAELRVTFFDPATGTERHPPITSTNWALQSGNYYFEFGNDDVSLANADHNAAWGWEDGDIVTFEILLDV